MNLDRVRLIRKLQLFLVDSVFQHQKRIIAEKMVMFARQNQMLLNCNSNTFIHDGVWYTAGDPTIAPIRSNYKPNRIIHYSLRDAISELNQLEFDARIQQGLLQVLFGQVLTTARITKDLYELLPYPLHPNLRQVDAGTFNYGPALTKEEIDQFKQENIDPLNQLKKMLLLKLLCSN